MNPTPRRRCERRRDATPTAEEMTPDDDPRTETHPQPGVQSVTGRQISATPTRGSK